MGAGLFLSCRTHLHFLEYETVVLKVLLTGVVGMLKLLNESAYKYQQNANKTRKDAYLIPPRIIPLDLRLAVVYTTYKPC